MRRWGGSLEWKLTNSDNQKAMWKALFAVAETNSLTTKPFSKTKKYLTSDIKISEIIALLFSLLL